MTLRWVGLKGRILRDSEERSWFAGISPKIGQQAVPTPSCWPIFVLHCIICSMEYDQAAALVHFTEDEQRALDVPAQLPMLDFYGRYADIKAAILHADSRLGEATEAVMADGALSADEYFAAGETNAKLTSFLLSLELTIAEIEDAALRRWDNA
jgi:hypothetical protein